MTDDRDTESQNPSKSFKVGEVDRLSGFFTPVWESKRRLRAESPIPASSAAASAPSSARGADKTARPSTPPPRPPARRADASQPAAEAGVARVTRSSNPPPRPSSAPTADAPKAKAAAATTATAANAAPAANATTEASAEKPSGDAAQKADAAKTLVSNTEAAKGAGQKAPRPKASGQRAATKGATPNATTERAAPVAIDTTTTLVSTPTAVAAPKEVAVSPEPPIAPPTQRDEQHAALQSPTAGARSSDEAQPVTPRVQASAALEKLAGTMPSADARALLSGAGAVEGAAPAAVVQSPTPEAPVAGSAVENAAGAQGVTVRPVIPMPVTPGRPALRGKPTPSSSNAPPLAVRPSEENAGAADAREREPDLRAREASLPRRRPPVLDLQRSGRAATSVLHEKLERKVPIDSADTFPRYRETESEREALQAVAARAAATPADPYPSHVSRTLRRTLHLSTPLPDAVRQMVEKYRY